MGIIVSLEMIFIAFGQWVLGKLLQPKGTGPFAELKNPATEELRQIYREIDADCGIIEPDLLTPEKKQTMPQWLVDKGYREESYRSFREGLEAMRELQQRRTPNKAITPRSVIGQEIVRSGNQNYKLH